MRISNIREPQRRGTKTYMIRVVLLDCEVRAARLEADEPDLRAAAVVVEGGSEEHGLLDDVVFFGDHWRMRVGSRQHRDRNIHIDT
jgi:hypothetical protein